MGFFAAMISTDQIDVNIQFSPSFGYRGLGREGTRDKQNNYYIQSPFFWKNLFEENIEIELNFK